MNPIIGRAASISRSSFTVNPSRPGVIHTVGQTQSTTVFVGNISDKVPDIMIRQLLGKCGAIITWKRLTGVNNKPQAFGFCEYENPESTLRCIRLLNGWIIADKALLVKVDEKTRTFLDEYLESKHPKGSGSAVKEGENYQVNGDQKSNEEDESVRQALQAILDEFNKELQRQNELLKDAASMDQKVVRKERLEGPKHLTIEDMGLDNEKKDLITREIEVFRKLHQDDDVDREHREREFRLRFQMQHMRSLKRLEESSQSPGRHSHRSESNKRHRSRSPGHLRPHPSRGHKSSKGKGLRSSGSDDEATSADKMRMEKKILLKETAYNHRLQNWMKREQGQARLYHKEMLRVTEKKRDAEVEAQRLLAFFQRYDDTRDDSKYYKGSNLTRRLRERSVEKHTDEQDHLKELEELEELRNRLLAEENPEAEAILLKAEQAVTNHLHKKLNVLDLEELPIVNNEEPSGERQSSDSERSPHSPGNAWKESPRSEQKKPPPFSSPHRNTESSTLNLSGAKEIIKQELSSNAFATVGKNRVEAMNAHSEMPLSSIGVKETNVSGEQTFTTLLEAAKKGDNNAKTEAVKVIIQRIPTEKEALFDYPIKWDAVNLPFVNERIRPWVDKKINAYVGEDVPSLSEFICEQVLLRKSPRNILQDVSMVLDDEAEVFVVKMWRLLIYVLQAKEAGIDS